MKKIDLCVKSPGKFMHHFLSSEEFTYCDVCAKPFKCCRLICKQYEKTVGDKEIREYMDVMRKA